MKKKILFIGPVPPPVGGVSIHISRLAQKISSTEDLSCAVFDIGRLKYFDHDLKNAGLRKVISFFISCNIVHIHLSHKWKVHIARFAKFFGKSVFYTRHNPRTKENSNTDERLHKIADMAIFVSLKSSELLDEKSHLIPAFIPSLSVSSLSPVLKNELSKYKNVICAISSHPEKKSSLINGEDLYGFDLLLQAYENCETRKDHLLLLIDPLGTMKSIYEEKLGKINAGGKPILYLTETIDFSSLVKYIHIYVRPTRSDGDSIAIREALEAGVKVLASDCCERPAGVKLFAGNNIESLATTLEIVLSMPKPLPEIQPDFSKMIIDLYRRC